MGFLKPKVPQQQQSVINSQVAAATPPPPPNTPVYANSGNLSVGGTPKARDLASFIGTSSQGLTSRASTKRRSLIGGG